MFDLENEVQGHRVQHSPRCHSKANISPTKVTPENISLALTVFEIFTFPNPDVENIVNVMIHSFAVVEIDCKYLTFNVMAVLMFALSFTVFEILMSQMFDLERLG